MIHFIGKCRLLSNFYFVLMHQILSFFSFKWEYYRNWDVKCFLGGLFNL